MITLCRAEERRQDNRGKREVWSTFGPLDPAVPGSGGFGWLDVLDELLLPPGAVVPGSRRQQLDTLIVTYVREGGLAYEVPATGASGVVQAGELQLVTTGRGARHRQLNASRTEWAHVFQLWVRPSVEGLAAGHEQRRFSAANRRGGLCVVASPDGRRGSLRMRQDALVYSALLYPGQHLVHELAAGRRAWLHVVTGAVTLGDLVLTAGDGAGHTSERAVSLTAREPTEILLVDLGDQPSLAALN